MAFNNIAITEVEMVSALGLDVDNSCAAARAGLIKLSPLKVINPIGNELLGGGILNGHIIPCAISHGFVGSAKALVLGSYSLSRLIKKVNIDSFELDKMGVIINLSNSFIVDAYAVSESEEEADSVWLSLAQKREQEYDDFIEQLLEKVGLDIPASNHTLLFGGRSGIANAIKNATTFIENGHFDTCIIGGIDSCIEPQFLEAAAKAALLKTSENQNGFLPGEGAGFILLEKASEGEEQKKGKKVFIGNVALQSENDEPSLATALTETINAVMEQALASNQKIGLIIGDLNGNESKAMEWGYALVRLENKYSLGSLPLWLPVINFGEIGAVAGLFAICMCIKGVQREYSPEQGALVFLSDDGRKAALTLFWDN